MKFTQGEINQLSTWFALRDPGKFINLLNLIPPDEQDAILDGSTTFDATSYINQAIDLAHNHKLRGIWFNGRKFWTNGDHVIYPELSYLGLGRGATELILRDGVPIDTCLFKTENFDTNVVSTAEELTNDGTFGFHVGRMSLNGNKQGIDRVITTLTSGIDADDETIPVASTIGFHADRGWLRIQNEVVEYGPGSLGPTSFSSVNRAAANTFAEAYSAGEIVEYIPMFGAHGLAIYGAQYTIENLRIENFRSGGFFSRYNRSYGGLFNYMNSRDPENSNYADLPDGDAHTTIRDIEIINNQFRQFNYQGPHDSLISDFIIAKDGDDLVGQPYWFANAGIYVGGSSSGDVLASGTGSQFSDGHVWGNHSFGIVQNTGGVLWHNVQSEGAMVQFCNRSGNAQGNLRLFGASGTRNNVGAWLTDGADMLTIRGESLDYAVVICGEDFLDSGTAYKGASLVVDAYTNNPANSRLVGAMDDTQTTFEITGLDVDGINPIIWPVIDNPFPPPNYVVFGVPWGDQRAPVIVTIDDEEIAIISRSGTTITTCIRGYNDTVPTTHTDNKSMFVQHPMIRGRVKPAISGYATVILNAYYNYEQVKARTAETFLRRGYGLTFDEKRQAFGVGSPVTDLSTKHKMMVGVTEVDPEDDYAVINIYGHMLHDHDLPTHTYHGMRSYLDSTFTDKTTETVHGITGEANFRGSGVGIQLTDAVGVYAGVSSQADSTGDVTRFVGVQTQLTHNGSGVVTTGQGIRVGTAVGSGIFTTLTGVHITNQGKAGTTTSYGLRILTQSGATTSYAIYSEGGHSRFLSGGSTIIPVGIQRAGGQTANLLNVYDSDGTTLLSYIDKDGAWNGIVGTAGSVSWSSITGKPTTLAGYGITDAAALVHSHTFASLTSKPTTLAGYGITDAAALIHTHAFSSLTAIPTTLTGYGIVGANALAGELVVTSTNLPIESVRQTTTNNAMVTSGRFRAQLTSGSMVDGFGAQQTFSIGSVIGAIGAVRAGADNTGDLVLYTATLGTLAERMRITADGRVSLNNAVVTARLQLRAGAATAGNAPLKFPVGTVLTVPEDGTLEYSSSGFFYTHGGIRTSFAAGSGTVTSVALAVPSILAVSGSPITTSGTLAVTLATQVMNTVFSGPSSGADATPTFRALVAADIPALALSTMTGTISDAQHGTRAGGTLHPDVIAAGASGFMSGADKTKLNGIATGATANTGTVTSVALTTPSFLSVAGSPVTTSGTLSVSLATQVMNTVFSGPSSGADAAPTFRSLVAADVPALALSTMTGTISDTQHGSRSGGTLHSNVIAAGSAGFMSGADKTKLDGIATGATANTGTVTSVAITLPSFLSVSGSPVTTSGTLAVTLATQSANLVFSGPTSGGAATPTFRSLVVADLPVHTHAWTDITSTPTTLAGYGIADAASISHTHAFSSLTSIPTTLSGYGITDAVPSSRTLTAGTGIAAIGDLSANRTIAIDTTVVPRLAVANTFLIGQVIDVGTAAVNTSGLQVKGAISGSAAVLSQLLNTNTAGRLIFEMSETAGGLDFYIVRRGSTSAALPNLVNIWNARNADTTLGTNNTERIRLLAAGGGTLTGAWNITGALTQGAVAVILEGDARLTDARTPTAHNQAWTTITSTPTTLAGYGITDAASSSHTHTFASLTSKPTTIAGYGITDAYTKTETDAAYATVAHTHTFASLTSKPTTLSGYGITDAVPSSRTLTAGTGIATIGDLSANRTIAIDTAVVPQLASANAFTTTQEINSATGGILVLRRIDTSVTAADMIGKIQFYAADTSTTTNFIVAEIEAQATNTVSTDINPGRLVFRTTPITVAAVPVERMRIDEAGNVSIGTYTAGFSLNVEGSGSKAFRIKSSDDNSVMRVDRGDSADAADIQFYTGGTGLFYMGLSRNANEDFGIRTGSGDTGYQFIIQRSTGNIGIGGVTNPVARLHIPAGTATAGSAPIVIASGTYLTTPVNGTVEYNGSFAITQGSNRSVFATAAVANGIPIAGSAGRLAAEWIPANFDPGVQSYMMDDFQGGVNDGSAGASGSFGSFGWRFLVLPVTQASIANHPGIVQIQTDATPTIGFVYALYATNNQQTMLGTETWESTYIFKVNQTVTQDVRVGLVDSLTNPPSAGAYIESLAGEASWFGVSRMSGTQTRSAALVALGTGWVKVKIRRVNSTTVGFSVNGGTEVTVASNTPTGQLSPCIQFIATAAVMKTIDVDYIDLYISGITR